ncbi:unnamed protein product, partial [Ectocarpus fasciculatus]
EVAFVYIVREHIAAAVTSILEVLRSSNEVSNYEFIIINDACLENEAPILDLFERMRKHFKSRIRYVKHDYEHGFSTSLTESLRMSKAYYVAIPGTECMVVSGWLHSLLYTIELHKDAGLVGSMALRGDGMTTDSTGGYVYRYGTHLTLFRSGFRPAGGSLFHARQVDFFTSSSAILFRREQYLELSSSLALTNDPNEALLDLSTSFLRHSGQKSYVQPFSLTIGSSVNALKTPSEGPGESDFLVSLKGRHDDLFTNYCPYVCNQENGFDEHMYTYLAHGTTRPHVLVVDNLMPEPDRDSGSIRLLEILRILRVILRYEVSLETMKLRDIRYMLPLLAMGVNVMPPRKKLRASNVLCPWDVIMVCRYRVALMTFRYIRNLCPKVPIIFDTVDVGFLRESRTLTLDAQNENRSLTVKETDYLAKIKRNELKIMKYATTTFVVSTYEYTMLKDFFSRGKMDLRILSNIYAKPISRPNITEDMFKQKSGLLFVGNMCHPPNQDAVLLLCNYILRQIVGTIDDEAFALHLVMSNLKNCENLNLIPLLEAEPHVQIYRDISDEELFSLHQKVRLFIAPLRAGAGVKGKLNYALWSGVPIVASGIASEGMNLVDGKSVLQADTALQFATAVKFVYNNYEIWDRLRQEGYKIHDKYYSAEIATKVLYDTLVSINTA